MSNKIVFAPAVALATVTLRAASNPRRTLVIVSATFVTTKGGKLTVCVTVLACLRLEVAVAVVSGRDWMTASARIGSACDSARAVHGPEPLMATLVQVPIATLLSLKVTVPVGLVPPGGV